MTLHPDFPVVEGDYRMTREWGLTLPGRFNRRVEEGDLVIWRPGLTFWVAVWGNDRGMTPGETLRWLLETASSEREAEQINRGADVIRLSYRLPEHDPERKPPDYVAISGYVISADGHVQISAYCDDDAALDAGYAVIESVRKMGHAEG